MPSGVGRTHLTILGFVSLALLFENYDLSLLGSALKFIADDLAIPEAELGDFTARIRLGALFVLAVIPLSDRLGRRGIFLISIVGLSLGTCLTAFSQTAEQFVWIQTLTRTFMVTAGTLAFVIVVEEFPAEHRGWGLGMLGALAAMGHGLGAGVFSAVEYLPYGWRALYGFGLLPVLVLPLFARGIPETRRFARQQLDSRLSLQRYVAPVVLLARRHPYRLLLIASLAVVLTAGHAAVFQFIGLYVMRHRGWEPGEYALMFMIGGGMGIIGNVIAGHLSDRVGRRWIGFAFMAPFPLFAYLFFLGPELGIAPTWVLLVFAVSAANIILRAFASELFPTRTRGTASGWISIMETLGAVLGLALVSAGMRRGLELMEMAPLISLGSLIGALLVLTLPETRARELEALSEEIEDPVAS